jgi:hypothetical protein
MLLTKDLAEVTIGTHGIGLAAATEGGRATVLEMEGKSLNSGIITAFSDRPQSHADGSQWSSLTAPARVLLPSHDESRAERASAVWGGATDAGMGMGMDLRSTGEKRGTSGQRRWPVGAAARLTCFRRGRRRGVLRLKTEERQRAEECLWGAARRGLGASERDEVASPGETGGQVAVTAG